MSSDEEVDEFGRTRVRSKYCLNPHKSVSVNNRLTWADCTLHSLMIIETKVAEFENKCFSIRLSTLSSVFIYYIF